MTAQSGITWHIKHTGTPQINQAEDYFPPHVNGLNFIRKTWDFKEGFQTNLSVFTINSLAGIFFCFSRAEFLEPILNPATFSRLSPWVQQSTDTSRQWCPKS